MQQDLLWLDPHVLLQGLVAGYVLLLVAGFTGQGFLEGSAF